MTITTARTPFLDFNSFSVEEAQEPPPLVRSAAPARSPFLSVYELNDGEVSQNDPVREAYASLINELHDEEFDEALFELQCRGRAMHDEQLAMGKPRAEADRLVAQHFSQLIHESEAMVDAMAREFAPREQAGIVEQRDRFVRRGLCAVRQPRAGVRGLFRKLAGKLGRVAKAAAGKAWQGIKKVALGPFFNQIKRAIRPILKRVLEWAIGKLPAPLQPVAQRLAQKLGFGQAKPAPASTDAALPQASSLGAARQLRARRCRPRPAMTPRRRNRNSTNTSPRPCWRKTRSSSNWRRRSSRAPPAWWRGPYSPIWRMPASASSTNLNRLGPDESAAPHIQNFLPALLPALRVGIRLVGRPRVVNFLAQLLAKLIAKLVGPEQAPALSRAIVDAGLKLLTLEMSEAETARLAPAAVAATIEETISRVASLPDEVLDNQELLEGYALEAFEHAAAANLPAVFSEATYRRRPDLLEAGVNAGWVLLPLRGPKRYKRCTRSFQVSVSPHLAEEVESFEGATLAEHLQDQLGLEEGEQVEAQLYLYEALPGTSLGRHRARRARDPRLRACRTKRTRRSCTR